MVSNDPQDILTKWTRMRMEKHQTTMPDAESDTTTNKAYTPECLPFEHGLDVLNVAYYLDQVLLSTEAELKIKMQMVDEEDRCLLRCTVLDQESSYKEGMVVILHQWQDHLGETYYAKGLTDPQGQVEFGVWKEYLPQTCVGVVTPEHAQEMEKWLQWLDTQSSAQEH